MSEVGGILPEIIVITAGVQGADGGGGSGDMLKSTYDPTNINASPFARANHTGTQAIATVSGLQAALDAKQASLGYTAEDTANKSTSTALGTSNILFPTQNAVKTYVDAAVGSGLSDGDKGEITITGGVWSIDSGVISTTKMGVDVTTAGKSMLTAADATAQKALLSLSNVDNTSDATKNSAAATLTNKTISGSSNTLSNIAQSSVTSLVTDLAAKQPLDSDLTAIAALSPSNDDIIQRKAGAWTNRTMAQLFTDLGLQTGGDGFGYLNNQGAYTVPAGGGGGGGEANLASNVGAGGVGVYKTKSGVTLQFKNINAGSNRITITDDTANNEIDIDVAETNLVIAQSQVTNLTSALAAKEPTITAGTTAQYWRGDKSFQTLDKTAVGLSNVDNTSDATKNSAVATLSNKTLTAPVINSPTGLVKADVGLGNVDNTSDATKNSAVATLSNKILTTPTIASFINATHTHADATNGGTIAEAVITFTDITTNNATISAHGYLRKLSGTATQYLDGSGNWSVPVGSGAISDGDKGDISVSSSGTVWTIDNSAVTYSKIQNVSATDKLLGRSTVGAGVIEEIACTAAGRALIDDADAAAQRTTLGLGAVALLATIATANIDNSAITSAKIATAAITPIKKAAQVTLTDAATVAIDASLAEDFYLSTANSRTLGVPTGTIRDGQFMSILVRNTSGGSITLTLTTGSTGAFAYTTDITALTATPAGTYDLLGFKWNSVTSRWMLVAYTKCG